ncbi:hypothetical protein [Mesorhizobium sp. 1B3]|uniref:hypothetical protein n=1 Tax=Mesorhizobium sp. 1B3 TaxID=3243599 RepID=UPI003D98F66E
MASRKGDNENYAEQQIDFRFASCLLSAACSAALADEKAWIVVDLERPDGKSVQRAFDNPAVPDMTLKECEDSLQSATRLRMFV